MQTLSKVIWTACISTGQNKTSKQGILPGKKKDILYDKKVSSSRRHQEF